MRLNTLLINAKTLMKKACETIIHWTIGKGVTGRLYSHSTGESWR